METTVQKKLIEFLDKDIDAVELAKYLRRFKYETVRMVLTAKDDSFCKEWIADGHYFLTELCEILDPQMMLDEQE